MRAQEAKLSEADQRPSILGSRPASNSAYIPKRQGSNPPLVRKSNGNSSFLNQIPDSNSQNLIQPSTSEYGALNYTSIAEYRFGKVLGQGAYAVVKEAQHKETGYNVAVKVYDKYKLIDDQRKKSVIKEIKLLKKMHHENIVALYDAIDTQR